MAVLDRREATDEVLAYARLTKEGLSGVNRQLSNGLRFNLPPSKKVIFLPSTVKMQVGVNYFSLSSCLVSEEYSYFEKGCREKSARDNPERYCGWFRQRPDRQQVIF